MNWELPDVQDGFRKSRGTRDQIANILWIIEKTREFQKNIYFCFIDYVKTFDCGSQQTVVNSSKRLEYQITFTVSWEICIQVKKQQLEPDREQRAGSKLGKEYNKAVYCHPVYLFYVQNTPCKLLGWIKHKPESNSNNHSYEDDTTLMAESEEELKRLLMKVIEWKSWFKTQHSEN